MCPILQFQTSFPEGSPRYKGGETGSKHVGTQAGWGEVEFNTI